MPRPRPLLLLLSCLLVVSPLGAQSHWSKVPAFPTSCYSADDTFNDQNTAAISAMQAAMGRQDAINTALKDQLSKLDAATKQSRMMAYMMKDPAKAGQMIEASRGAGGGPELAKLGGQIDALEAEYRSTQAKYRAEHNRVLEPFMAGATQHDASRTTTEAQVKAAMEKYNGAYKSFCAAWFPAGAFPDFLARFRTNMIETHIPVTEKADGTMKTQLEMFGIDAKEYQSLAGMTAVLNYMKYAASAFGERETSPKVFR